MNKELKSAIYRKKMLFNKFQQVNSSKNWEAYRKQRNVVTKLKNKSVNNYFIERCASGPKSRDFWPTVKPFLTNKGSICKKEKPILSENDVLITKQDEVCDIFNTSNYFVNAAKNIGNNCTKVDDAHPSIVLNNIIKNKLVERAKVGHESL